jgi:hypothetical protein
LFNIIKCVLFWHIGYNSTLGRRFELLRRQAPIALEAIALNRA